MSKIVCPLSLSQELVAKITQLSKDRKGSNRSQVAEELIWKGIESMSSGATHLNEDAIVQKVLKLLNPPSTYPEARKEASPHCVTNETAASAVNSIIRART